MRDSDNLPLDATYSESAPAARMKCPVCRAQTFAGDGHTCRIPVPEALPEPDAAADPTAWVRWYVASFAPQIGPDDDYRIFGGLWLSHLRMVLDRLDAREREYTLCVSEIAEHTDRIGELLDERAQEATRAEQAERENVAMRAALVEAARAFDYYAKQHASKGTPDGDSKADANRRRAEACRDALSSSRGSADHAE